MTEYLIKALANYLQSKYHCHSIICYGSLVTGDFTEESDIDAVCFCDQPQVQNDNSHFGDHLLDVWIYDTAEMYNSDAFLHLHNGLIILDEQGQSRKLMGRIEEIYKRGPSPLSEPETMFLKNWLSKMLLRTIKGDVEGNYRLHMLLTDCLESYFKLRNIWYQGPKQALQWLQAYDANAYELFSRALRREAWYEEVKALIEYICR